MIAINELRLKAAVSVSLLNLTFKLKILSFFLITNLKIAAIMLGERIIAAAISQTAPGAMKVAIKLPKLPKALLLA